MYARAHSDSRYSRTFRSREIERATLSDETAARYSSGSVASDVASSRFSPERSTRRTSASSSRHASARSRRNS
jgi:hypothetical protein